MAKISESRELIPYSNPDIIIRKNGEIEIPDDTPWGIVKAFCPDYDRSYRAIIKAFDRFHSNWQEAIEYYYNLGAGRGAASTGYVNLYRVTAFLRYMQQHSHKASIFAYGRDELLAYVQHLKQDGLTVRSVRNYMWAVEVFYKGICKEIKGYPSPFDALTKDDYDFLYEEEQEVKKVKPTLTEEEVLAIFDFTEHRFIPYAMLDRAGRHTHANYLQYTEEVRLRQVAIFKMFYYTGMRFSELMGKKRYRFEPHQFKDIITEEDNYGVPFKFIRTKQKGQKFNRAFVMKEDPIEAVRKYFDCRTSGQTPQPEDYLFAPIPCEKGDWFTANTGSRGLFGKLRTQLQEQKVIRPRVQFSPHCWRRTLNTHLAIKGYCEDFKDWQLRHTPTSVRMKAYEDIEGSLSKFHDPINFRPLEANWQKRTYTGGGWSGKSK